MGYITVKNWEKFQHYKDRNPPWIKLATDTFQNYEFSRLQDASKLLAVCIWTLAARSKEGKIPDDLAWIKRQSNLSDLVVDKHYKELFDNGYISRCSGVLADCKQVATPETETEGETEGETETDISSVDKSTSDSPRRKKSEKITFDFQTKKFTGISEDKMKFWEESYPAINVRQELMKIAAWLDANPKNRKNDYPRFIIRWLSKEQDRAPRKGNENGKRIDAYGGFADRDYRAGIEGFASGVFDGGE